MNEKNNEVWWTTPPNKQQLQPHVIIDIPYLSSVNSRAEIARFYESGFSLREIQKRFHVPKTTVREALIKEGVARRASSKSQNDTPEKPVGMRSGVTPFGYTYLEGKLVLDPHEYKTVLEILRLLTKGKSIRAIARYLNDQNIRTRKGKFWSHFAINSIIEREKQNKGGPHGT